MILVATLFLAGFLAGCPNSSAGSSGFLSETPCAVRARFRLEVQHDLSKMLSLLDEGHHDRFLAEYMDPRVVERLDGATSGSFQAEFAESALARELHAAIRSAVAAEPDFGKDTGLATFEQAEAGRRLMLRKMDGRWRVLD
jgi:hypothetical protein